MPSRRLAGPLTMRCDGLIYQICMDYWAPAHFLSEVHREALCVLEALLEAQRSELGSTHIEAT